MRSILAVVAAGALAACGAPERHDDGCIGLECSVDDCASRGLPPTTISGTVYAPNGTLPLYGVNVYVPRTDPGALVDGVACSQCQDPAPGGSVGEVVQSDAAGHFSLGPAPSGPAVPLVIQTGKWRRRVDVSVTACTDNPLPAAHTSLPRTKAEGDIPRIALTTGCDTIECLLRRLGVSDTEFTAETGSGRVNLFASDGVNALADGTQLPSSETLWSSLDKLKQYDIAMFACECIAHYPVTTTEMTNVRQFADLGGRIFMTHYNAQWLTGTDEATQQEWPEVASCTASGFPTGPGEIDQVSNPKGVEFATWMQNVGASTSLGEFPIRYNTQSCTSINPDKAERWVYIAGTPDIPQNFQFTTPLSLPLGSRCGKVVFADMHVSDDGAASTGSVFPANCNNDPLSPEEKALAFMFFEISSCVGTIL